MPTNEAKKVDNWDEEVTDVAPKQVDSWDEEVVDEPVKKKVTPSPSLTQSSSNGLNLLSGVIPSGKALLTGEKEPIDLTNAPIAEDESTRTDKFIRKHIDKKKVEEVYALSKQNESLVDEFAKSHFVLDNLSQTEAVKQINDLYAKREQAKDAKTAQAIDDQIEVLKSQPVEKQPSIQEAILQNAQKYGSQPQDFNRPEIPMNPLTPNQILKRNGMKTANTVGELHDRYIESANKLNQLRPELDKTATELDKFKKEARTADFKTDKSGNKTLEGLADVPEAFGHGFGGTMKSIEQGFVNLLGDKQDRIDYAKKRYLEDNVLYPTRTKGMLTSGSEMVGGVAPYVISTAVLPETALLGHVIINGLTMGVSGYGNGYYEMFAKQKQQGRSDEEADAIAMQNAKFEGAKETAIGASLPFMGGAGSKLFLAPAEKSAMKEFLATQGVIIPTFTAGKLASNTFQKYGLGEKDVNLGDGLTETAENGLILGAMMEFAHKAPTKLKEMYRANISEQYPSIQQAVDKAVQDGVMDASQASAFTEKLKRDYSVFNAMPKDITTEQKLAIEPEVKQIIELSNREPSAVENPEVTKDKIVQLQKQVAEKLGTPLTEKEQKSYEKLQEIKGNKEDKLLPSEKAELTHYEKRIETAKENEVKLAEQLKQQENDKKDTERLQSDERIGQEPIQAEPNKTSSGETSETSGNVLQNEQEEVEVVSGSALKDGGRTAKAVSKRVAVEHAGYEGAKRITGANENTLELDGYGTVSTSQFINTLVENGRLPKDALKNRHIQLTDEYATKLLNENSDLFPKENTETNKTEANLPTFESAKKEYDNVKEKHNKYLKKDGGLRANTPDNVKKEIEDAYTKMQSMVKQERDKRVSEDKRDTGLIDGIERIKDNTSAFTLVRMAMNRGVIPERQFNEFGKNLLHIIADAKDSHEVTMQTAEIIQDFSQRANVKVDDLLAREIQAAENLKYEPVEEVKAPTQYTEAATQKKESGGVSSSALKDVETKTNTVNGYEFSKTPTLESVIVEPIDKSNNVTIEKQMFVDENKNVLAKGVKYVGGGWYEIGGDNFGSVDLYNTVTKEGVSLNHKQGGRMGVVVQDFIKNNSRYNDNIAVRGSKFTEAEHNPNFGGSGHYKGTYFYVGLNAESKALEHGKNLSKVDIENANLYELGGNGQTSQSLKNEAKKAGYDTRDASGYAESEYLKKQGYDGIKRGNEIVLFEPKKFESKAPTQYTEEAGVSGSALKDVEKYSEPKRYNSEIEVGQKYYDNRYGDFYTIEKMTPVEGGDVDVTLKYDKGKTRTESGNFLLYHIDAKQHSLSKEQPIVAEASKQEKTNDYYIYDFDNKEFVKVDNAKSVKLDTEGDFFAVKGDNGYYTIYEGTSGQGIGQSGKLLRDAIKNANESIERNSKAGFPLEMAISGGIKRNGLSPRVKQAPTQYTEAATLKEQPKAEEVKAEVETPTETIQEKGRELTDAELKQRLLDDVDLFDMAMGKEPIPNDIKTAIDNGEITREQADGFIEQDESVIEDIERKAESENEAELNSAIDQADKLIGEATTRSEGKTESSNEKVEGGEVKKTLVTKRAYEGSFREGVKKELEAIGLTRESENFEKAEIEAKKFFDEYGEDVAIEAMKEKDIEGALAAFVWNEITKSVDKKLSEAIDIAEIEQLQKKQAQLLDIWGKQQRSAGAFNAAMAKIYETSELGYSYEKQKEKWEGKFGEPMPKEIAEKFKQYDTELSDLKKRITEAEKKVKEAEEKQAFDNIVAEVKQKPKAERSGRRKIAEGLDELTNALGVKLSAVGDKKASATKALIKIGEGLIEEGIATAKNVAEKIREYVEDKFKGKIDIKEYEPDILKHFEETLPKITERNGKIHIPDKLIKELVKNGAETIENLVSQVKEIAKADFPDITDREIRDSITKYGKTQNPTKDEILAKVSRMKRIGRLLSQLEDVQNKIRPLKSGLQRERMDAQERAMNKQLREELRNLPVDEETLAGQIRTVLDARKQGVQNRIEDLQREIEQGEKTPKNQRTIADDEALTKLKEQLEKVKAEHQEKFAEQNEAEKEAKRLSMAKKNTQKRIEDLSTRLREGNFSKVAKREIKEDAELTKLRADKIRIQEEFDKEFNKQELLNKKGVEKLKDRLWEAWSLPRALMATGEMSFVGVQGLINTIAHPIESAKALKRAFEFGFSEKKTEQWLHELKSQEYYPLMKKSKLSLTEPNAELTAREELFYSGWTNMIWDTLGRPLKLKSDSAYEKWKELNPMRGVERASVGYLDTQRVSRFLDGMEMLKEKGITYEENPQAYKDMADVINTFTGRASLGKLEMIAPTLSKVFFSPRNWASALKVATPYAMYHFGKMRAGADNYKPSTAQKMAISDLSKYIGVTTSMVMMAAASLNNDDDESTGVEFDPRSSDFMKIKIGDKRIDPWGGKIQQIIFSSRVLMDVLHEVSPSLSEGGYKKKDEIMPLGVERKSPTLESLSRTQATNKLAPTMALLNKYASTKIGKDGKRKDEFGNDFELSEEAKKMLKPIYWGTVGELLKEDPSALNGLLAFYAFFGGGVNIYGKKKEKKKD